MTSISIGHKVLLAFGDNERKFVVIEKGSKKKILKKLVSLDPLIGAKYGSTFLIENCSLVPLLHDFAPLNLSSVNNQKFEAESKESHIQRLKQEEILELKNSLPCDEVVARICKGSTTFSHKTEFSQQKYIKKKIRKHAPLIQIIPSTTRNICDAWFSKSPQRIQYLHSSTLAMMLHFANIHAGVRVIVIDNVCGLLTGAVTERLGGKGQILAGYNSKQPQIDIISCYNFSKDIKKCITYFPLSIIGNYNDNNTIFHILSDTLLIASNYSLNHLVYPLLDLIRPGSPFVIYSMTIEPLISLQSSLIKNKRAVDICVHSTFYREHQILSSRTHPKMNTTEGGVGFFLRGITIPPEQNIILPDNDTSTFNRKRKNIIE